MKIEEYYGKYKDNKIVIWGTAIIAKKVSEIMKNWRIKIIAYCDNDRNKWGKQFNGVTIISPDDLKEICEKEDILLIVGNAYYKEIKEQVKTYALNDIIDYKEIYMLDGSKRIAQMYDLEADSIINILKGNLEESDLFEDNIYCIERLEYELENIMPELKKKYGLSICAIIKNEGNYILEWLEFHRLVGVEHFYIYDNDSTDGLYELIKDYIEKDIVTYINWPGVKQQLPAYNNAIERYKYESKYIAFIDADEFLFPVEGELLLPVIEDIF